MLEAGGGVANNILIVDKANHIVNVGSVSQEGKVDVGASTVSNIVNKQCEFRVFSVSNWRDEPRNTE